MFRIVLHTDTLFFFTETWIDWFRLKKTTLMTKMNDNIKVYTCIVQGSVNALNLNILNLFVIPVSDWTILEYRYETRT